MQNNFASFMVMAWLIFVAVMAKDKHIYFASDFHLGAPNLAQSHEREQRIIRWLTEIGPKAEAIYLLGDLFDFWQEYDTVIPKGFVRFLGKLAELSDQGIDVQVFTGNHDLWMRGYFQDELGIPVFFNPEERTFNGKRFLIGHGDGLGNGDDHYKFLRGVFHNPFFQFLFRWVHPDIGMRIAHTWSRKSRASHKEPERFLGEDKEWLVQYCKDVLQHEHYDYFIFGHRHLPLQITLHEKGSQYINLGEWISQNTYAVFDGEQMELHTYST